MFSKILIANRGEIACRIIRTARRMGIATVAVYSEADAGALHVEMADEARPIGPPPARESYLRIDRIVAAATESGAEAVHPGYGFLSENAEFAEACAASGIVFIGPSPPAIRAMGSKAAAKALMEQHGVPVVPGYHGDDQDDERLFAEAELIGYPVLLKASAGGGGRGMRVVEHAGDFARALDGARRESKNAFGDDRMLVERYLERPRHIEVQVFGDTHGNIVHLGERDCSIQRRHQKIVEEAPAPGLDEVRRDALGAAAVAAAAAVDYVGAGTIEFIADRDGFYFMEMNTRLQVEHPVTEAVTGLDLVEWQLRVAAGETLPLRQAGIARRGRAIEVRLYAENPARGFLPSTGTLQVLRMPEGDGIRVETGVRQGDAVTPFYDPMIAKIIAWGEDRAMARSRLGRALAATGLFGVTTNLDFLRQVVADQEFAAGRIDTGFVERRRDVLLAPVDQPSDAALAAVTLYRLLSAPADLRADPWSRGDGWRLNLAPAAQTLTWRFADGEYEVAARAIGMNWELRVGERTFDARGQMLDGGEFAATLDGVRRHWSVLQYGGTISVSDGQKSWIFEESDKLAPPEHTDIGGGLLTAPMPGRVIQLLVAAGEQVHRGQPLLVLEAMKMEHTIAAPRDGVVATVHYAAGDLVDEGAELIALAEIDGAAAER